MLLTAYPLTNLYYTAEMAKVKVFRHVSLLIGMLDDVRRGVASCKRSECLVRSAVNGPVSFEPVAHVFIFPLGV